MFWNRGEKGISFTDRVLEKALGDSSEPVKKIEVNKRKPEVVREEPYSEAAPEIAEETVEEIEPEEETVHIPVIAEDAPVVLMETVLEAVEESHEAHSPDPVLETAQEVADDEAFDLLPQLKPKHVPVQVADIPTIIPMATEDGVAHVSIPEEKSSGEAPHEEEVLESEEVSETAPLQRVEVEVPEVLSSTKSIEIELSPLERMPVHKDQYFRLESGETLKSIKDLIHSLEKMDQLTWNHHVKEGRNDFANWVEHVFKDKELAHRMKDFQNAHTLRVFLRNAF